MWIQLKTITLHENVSVQVSINRRFNCPHLLFFNWVLQLFNTIVSTEKLSAYVYLKICQHINFSSCFSIFCLWQALWTHVTQKNCLFFCVNCALNTNDIFFSHVSPVASPQSCYFRSFWHVDICTKVSCLPHQFQKKWSRAPSPSPPPSARLTDRPWATLWSVPVAATTSAWAWARSVTAWRVLRTSPSGSRPSTGCTRSAGGETELRDGTWEAYLDKISSSSLMQCMCLCVCLTATQACWLCLRASQTQPFRESAAATGRIASRLFAGGIHEQRPSCCGLQASMQRE